MRLSQSDAADMFGLPTVTMYVCDGSGPCGKPSCRDYSKEDACHHTRDLSRALYKVHPEEGFQTYPAVTADGAVLLHWESVRG